MGRPMVQTDRLLGPWIVTVEGRIDDRYLPLSQGFGEQVNVAPTSQDQAHAYLFEISAGPQRLHVNQTQSRVGVDQASASTSFIPP